MKKNYEKPTMLVVKPRTTGMLMTSGTGTQVENYQEWEEEDI